MQDNSQLKWTLRYQLSDAYTLRTYSITLLVPFNNFLNLLSVWRGYIAQPPALYNFTCHRTVQMPPTLFNKQATDVPIYSCRISEQYVWYFTGQLYWTHIEILLIDVLRMKYTWALCWVRPLSKKLLYFSMFRFTTQKPFLMYLYLSYICWKENRIEIFCQASSSKWVIDRAISWVHKTGIESCYSGQRHYWDDNISDSEL